VGDGDGFASFRVFEVGDCGMVDARAGIASAFGSSASRVVIAGW
jgi:hypothetical protein